MAPNAPKPSRAGRLAALLTAVGLGIAGFGSIASAAPVSPETYIQSVCEQVASTGSEAATAAAALNQAAAAYKTSPSQASAVAVRRALFDMLENTATATDRLVASAAAAGTPDVANGAVFARAVLTHLRSIATALHRLGRSAAVINVGDSTRFGADVKRVLDKTNAAQKRVDRETSRDKAFVGAPPELHPLVVFMTTNVNACPAS